MVDCRQLTNIYESPPAPRETLVLYPHLASDEGKDELQELIQRMGTEDEYRVGQGTLPLSSRSIALVLPESEAIVPEVIKGYLQVLGSRFASLTSLTCFAWDVASMVCLSPLSRCSSLTTHQTLVIDSISALNGKLRTLRFFVDSDNELPDTLFDDVGESCPGLCLVFSNNVLCWSR